MDKVLFLIMQNRLTELTPMTIGMMTKVIVVRRQDAASMKMSTRMAWVMERIMTLMLREICKLKGS